MPFSISYCAYALLAFWIVRILIRSFLALRFHFRFERVGFFSISNVRYHHHRSPEAALWSVKIGKLKLRLRNRPSWSSPTAYITVSISNVNIKLHNLSALAATRHQNSKKSTNHFNKRFSRVSSSLKKIPWWYSLSIVKHLIKFTSALPAQFLMAGLANYVDVQIDDFILDVENQASFKVQHANFSSILFANVAIPNNNSPDKVSNSKSSPGNEPALTQLQQLSLHHSSYQRHSLKRARHLFNEKFFEIMVKIGPVSITGRELTKDMLRTTNVMELPKGGNIAISCHLSAGCVTLKDIDIKTRVDMFKVELAQLLKLNRGLKEKLSANITKDEAIDQEQHTDSSAIQLFRSISLSVDNIVIEMQHQNECYSNLSLHELCISGVVESHILDNGPYYKLNILFRNSTFDTFEKNSHESVPLFTLPKVKLTSIIAQSLLSPKTNGRAKDTSLFSITHNEKMEQLRSDDALAPNKNFIDVSMTIQEPKIYLDVSKSDILAKLSRSAIFSHTITDNKDSEESKPEKQSSHRYHNLIDIPKTSISIFINDPSVQFKSKLSELGTISWSGVALELSGIYYSQKNRPISVLPIHRSDSTKLSTNNEDHIEHHSNSITTQRIQHQPKASWTSLFRRSWKPKEADLNDKKKVEWFYETNLQVNVQNTCFDYLCPDEKQEPSKNCHPDFDHNSTAFLSIGNFKCNSYTKLNVSFIENAGITTHTNVVLDLDHHHITVDTTLDKPILNLWATTFEKDSTQLEFWSVRIFNELKSDLKRPNVVSVYKNTSKSKKSTSDIFTYASVIKMNFVTTDAAIVFGGTDEGLKGKRAVPAGYIDNAPEKDIDVRIVVAVQKISLTYSGSRIFTSARDSDVEDEDNEDVFQNPTNEVMVQHIPFGTCRLSTQHIIMERVFKPHNLVVDELDWHHYEDRKSVLLWISRIDLRVEIMLTSLHHQMIIIPSVVVKKSGIQYSMGNHYACLITAISTISCIKRCIPKKDEHSPEESHDNKQITIHKLQFQVNRIDVHIYLPNGGTELYVRMDSLRAQWDNVIEHHGDVPATAIRNIALFGQAPNRLNKWDQLLELDDIQFSVEKDIDFSTGELIKTSQLSVSKFYLRIPYGYELSNFVDGSVTLVKSIKATHNRVSKSKSFLFYGPNMKNSPSDLPRMRLVCDLFTFQFEDDPFEARLRSIWRTGVIEQANRNAIEDAFEMKAQIIMSGHDGDSIYTSEEADIRVNDAWQALQEHNSNSWKRHIDSSLHKETSKYEQLQETYYRHTIITDKLDEVFDDSGDDKHHYLSEMFCISIAELPLYPPLLDMTIKDTSLDFRTPDFELGRIREFIYDVGKGQPVDTPLSTLIPFHLDWKAGETWAQIRDYPVPFFFVPSDDNSPTDSQKLSSEDLKKKTGSAWTLHGNYALADDMGDLDAARQVHVHLVDEHSISYAIDVVRVTTPLKFFSIVDIDVHNSSLSHICWSVPYQPAIQDITQILDTFTRPPVDPSEKVGFWDKIRLIIHTRAKISFIGGGDLSVVMKGTRDPYDMSENGFGLAKVWRNDVVWLLGHSNPQGEFMQIISNDYAFGVPDLVHGGYTTPSIIAADKIKKKLKNSTDSIGRSFFMSSFNSSNTTKNSESNYRLTKIALKLSGGIRMGLGCHLERVCSTHCETCEENSNIMSEAREIHKSKLLDFLPHYKVRFKAPKNVHEKNYDAYKGFRSDYIHLSLSIIKMSDYDDSNEKGSVTGNSMHLTPGFIDHFVSWFRLFGGAMSYPLRYGSLFPKADTRQSKKFGRHMNTMKFKIVVNPLTVGYFMKDENINSEEDTIEELGDSVGLKGFVKAFSADIHQKREIVNIADSKLDQKRLKANWPMSEAEIQLKNIDMRAVRARYSIREDDSGIDNVSVPVTPDLSQYSDDSDIAIDLMEGLNYKCNKDSDSSDWVDLDDFIELNVLTPATLPVIQVLPFAFSPCIYFLRQKNRDDIQKHRYLHCTHDCILGTSMDTREIQMNLLDDRKKNIDIQIRKHQTRLHGIELKRLQHGEDEKELKELSDAIVEKTKILYEKRELLQRYLKELSTQAMPDVVHNQPSKAYSNSAIFGKDPLSKWEEFMGSFNVRYIAHNPQILWNNSVRNILYHALDLREHRRALSYYLTSRTAKFLRDLIDASGLEYDSIHKPLVLDENEGGMDISMAEELIAKLLSEQDTNLYALNEVEESKSIGDKSESEVDMSRSDNINKPEMQIKSIPSNYVMKSSYLVDLLNPQISLQSDCDTDNIVLVANERTQVKGFNIVDETDPDADMETVKHRTIVSLDNVQFFVAKKEQFDSVDLLLDNHYGAKESDHWLAWIPPEMLIDYVKRSDKFQRIGTRIAATLQYDKYNPLRIKAYSKEYSKIHLFEDRCDTVQLNFPQLKLTADSSQYNAIYQVATDLLLYKEPAKQERLARLREIMMAADRASPFEATEKIVSLQNRARQLIHARDQYRRNITFLDKKRIEEFKTIRSTLYETMEELYLGMEAIKLMQSNQKKGYHEHKTNLKFVFCAEKFVWEMLSKSDTPLCEWNLTNFNFIFVSKEDHSSTNTLEVDIIQVKNTSTNPVFADVVGPYFDSRKPYDFSRHKMLRCYFVSLAPVGGIPVIQHLEINLHPLRAQITNSFGKSLAYYLFPPEKSQKHAEIAPIVSSSSAPTSTSSANTATAASSTSGGTPESDTIFENQHLSMATLAGSHHASDRADKEVARSDVSTRTVESAPAAIPIHLTSNDSHKTTHSSNIFMTGRDDEDAINDNTISSQSLSVHPKKSKKQALQKLTKLKTPDDLSVMKKRASSNRAFILVKIPGARHCLSYQGPKEKNIEDLRDFAFEQPTLEFRNETWSWFELMSNIRKDFMRAALLHNSTALLKEKLLRRHPREQNKLIDSSISLYNPPVFVADASLKQHQRPSNSAYDADDNSDGTSSSKDDPEEVDINSVHSAKSQENWDEGHETTSKRSHIWSKLKKPKRSTPDPISPGHSSHTFSDTPLHEVQSKFAAITEEIPLPPRSISAATRNLRESDQLTVKGRYLLGKYYNGPTQWLAPGTKAKGKQISSKKI